MHRIHINNLKKVGTLPDSTLVKCLRISINEGVLDLLSNPKKKTLIFVLS